MQTKTQNPRRGAMMVLVVILLPVLFALAAFAINVAHMETLNTDVQIAVDAAVRAAGREYANSGDESLALAAAQTAATKNPIGDFVLPIAAADLEFGDSTRSSENDPYVFTASGSGNSVRLTTNSFANGNGPPLAPVFPFFGSSFEIRPQRSAISTQGLIDIALVVDRSGSMAYSALEIADPLTNPASAPPGWEFGDPCPPNARWLDLIAAVHTFSNELEDTPQDELMSLTMYNTSATRHMNLSDDDDYEDITDELVSVSMNFTSGGTNIGSGLIDGMQAVNDPVHGRSFAAKVIVLMTDGVHNYGLDPLSAANSVKNSGVTVFTVTFSNEADQALMEQVANKCGGKHFHAVTAVQLQNAFRDIARSLPTMITK